MFNDGESFNSPSSIQLTNEQDYSRTEIRDSNFCSTGHRKEEPNQTLQVRYKSEPKKGFKLSKHSAQSISKSLRKLSKDIDLKHFEQLSTVEAIKMESELLNQNSTFSKLSFKGPL